MKHSERLEALRKRLTEDAHINILSDDENVDLLKAISVIEKVEDGRGFRAVPTIGAIDGKPRVDVVWLGQLANVPIDMVRSIAGELVKAAAAAENDAVLVRFLKEEVDIEGTDAATMLKKFREYRERPDDNHASMIVKPFSTTN